MLDTLITNKTRIKLLLRFFLNSNSKSYLRGLQGEFDESTNAIRLELNRFEKAGLLVSDKERNRKVYKANSKHPLYPEIHNIVRKYFGFDQIVDRVVRKLGKVKEVYVTGDFAHGKYGPIIDLVFVGDGLNTEYLARLVKRTEVLIHRRIRYVVFGSKETDSFKELLQKENALLLFKNGGEHNNHPENP
ncbi:MAG TPA: hypothetical protein VMC08_02250 [Bacteroidales bacterium]|nr:hypothetical protein [Bacteroidales bacterium]